MRGGRRHVQVRCGIEQGGDRAGEELLRGMGKRSTGDKEGKGKKKKEKREREKKKRKEGEGKKGKRKGGGRAFPRFDKNRGGWLQEAGGRNRKRPGQD